jgi:hypothetical protein
MGHRFAQINTDYFFRQDLQDQLDFFGWITFWKKVVQCNPPSAEAHTGLEPIYSLVMIDSSHGELPHYFHL